MTIDRQSGPADLEKGQGVVEHGILIALVALVVMVMLFFFGPAVGQVFSSMTNPV